MKRVKSSKHKHGQKIPDSKRRQGKRAKATRDQTTRQQKGEPTTRMNDAQVRRVIEVLGTICSASAVQRFDTDRDQVRRVVLKVNPQVFGQFLVLAIMRNDLRYEGVVNQATHLVEWCVIPNCTRRRFIATHRPLEAGFTIDG